MAEGTTSAGPAVPPRKGNLNSPAAAEPANPPIPPVEQPAAPEEAPTDSEGKATIKAINDNWRQLLSQVNRQGPNTAALLRSGRVLGVKDGVIYFGFASELLKSKMEKSENIELVREAINQLLKTDVSLRCVVASGKSNALPPDVDSDGMVASALRDLGGEIVDIQ